MSLDRTILAAVKCTICGAGYGKCDCWQKCPDCGWFFEKGTRCRNCHGDATPQIMATTRRKRMKK